MSILVGGIAATLAAMGIILIIGVITYEVIKEKLRNKDFFRAIIKERKNTAVGIPIIRIDLEDAFGNSMDQMKLASAEGIDVPIGMNIYKSQL